MSHKTPNPDEVYAQKAMLEPAAPVTVWLFPELKLLAGKKQRAAIAEARRVARRHWISRALQFSLLASSLLGLWLLQMGRDDFRPPLPYVALLATMALLLFDYLHARAWLRAAVASTTGRTDV